MPKRIVIVGGGFGGAYCARALEKKRPSDDLDVVLIDRNNYFVFYPLLVEAGTGSLEPRHVVVPIRSFLRAPGAFRMAEIDHIDPDAHELSLRGLEEGIQQTLQYDHLVLALGSVTNLPDLPGLRRFGFEMKGLSDAVALRDRVIGMLERAQMTDEEDVRRSLLHFVVVGANFTGVEVAGEYHAFLKEAARRYPHIDPDECRVTLVEVDDRILGALDPHLADYAVDQLRKRGVAVRLGMAAAEIREDRLILSDGTTLPTCTVIWCAGIAPNPLQRGIDLPVDQRGYIMCQRNLRVLGHDDLWAIGDCAVNIDEDGKPYPATAQHAVRQGVHLARNLALVLAGNEPEPYRYRSRGTLAALGCRTGVAELFGIKMSGFWAWWAFRTVYLSKMPGIARKLRVAIDWTIELLFPREVVQLGLHRRGSRDSETNTKRTEGPD